MISSSLQLVQVIFYPVILTFVNLSTRMGAKGAEVAYDTVEKDEKPPADCRGTSLGLHQPLRKGESS
jgi:hypothetical protein